MIKTIETVKYLTSVEKDGKIMALYFENELPPLGILCNKFGKDNIRISQIRFKKAIYFPSKIEQRLEVNRKFNKKRAIP